MDIFILWTCWNFLYLLVIIVAILFLWCRTDTFKHTSLWLILSILIMMLCFFILDSDISYNLLDLFSTFFWLDVNDGLFLPILSFIPPFIYIFIFNRLIEDLQGDNKKLLFIINFAFTFLVLLVLSIFSYDTSAIDIYWFRLHFFYILLLIISIFIIFFILKYNKTKVRYVNILILLFILWSLVYLMYNFKIKDDEMKKFFLVIDIWLFISILFNFFELFYLLIRDKFKEKQDLDFLK